MFSQKINSNNWIIIKIENFFPNYLVYKIFHKNYFEEWSYIEKCFKLSVNLGVQKNYNL